MKLIIIYLLTLLRSEKMEGKYNTTPRFKSLTASSFNMQAGCPKNLNFLLP